MDEWEVKAKALLPCVCPSPIKKLGGEGDHTHWDTCKTVMGFRPAVADALRKVGERLDCGHRVVDWDDGHGECVFCKMEQRAEDYDRLPHDVIACHDRIEELEVERDMWLADSAKQNASLGRVIAERDDLQAIIYSGNAAIQRQIELTTKLEAERDAAVAQVKEIRQAILLHKCHVNGICRCMLEIESAVAEIDKTKAEKK